MTTPPQAAALTPPNGGNCATRGSDTPTTRPLKASCSAKPPPPPARRAPEGPEGLAAVPVGGGVWPRCWSAAAGPDRASSRRAEPHVSDTAPLVWRAPEGPEGLAAVPVGGGGAWPGFETTRRATRQRHSPTGVEGAGGTGGHGRASRRGAERSEAAQPRGRPGPPAPGTPVGPQPSKVGSRRPRAHQAAHPRACVKPRPADAGRGFRYPVGYEV